MSVPILQLPAGTNVTKMINLPKCGGWLGNVAVSAITPTDCTIHEWIYIYPDNPDGKIRYRRTAIEPHTNYSDWTLKADRKVIKWMVMGESALKLRYTSTSDISIAVETTKLIKPFTYPLLPFTPHPTEQSVNFPSTITTSVVYWKNSA